MFELHAQLRADCHALGVVGTTQVLLHRNAAVPWFILVPATNALEVFELPEETQRELMRQANELARFVKRFFNSDKINVAALGNIVPQLHVHVIGRRRDDPVWPKPIWGHLEVTREYRDDALLTISAALEDACGLVAGSN